MTPHFKHAIGKIMRPVVRLMLRNGIDVAELMAEVRHIYVDVAQESQFALIDSSGQRKKITVSRMAVLTGINRKEVKRLIDAGVNDQHLDYSNANRAVRVISGWLRDERFSDEAGKPRVLTFGSMDDTHRFEDLVKEYSGDLTPRVILDELIRVGSVSKDKSGKIHLIEKGYIPAQSDEELLRIGSQAISDLASTVAFNVNKAENEKSMIQMSVSYNDVPDQGVAMFRSIVKSESESFLGNQNKLLSTLDRSSNPELEGSGRYRIGVGVYYFEKKLDD